VIVTSSIFQRVAPGLLALGCVLAVASYRSLPVSANHPVLVEGEKDFDGDGRTGAAEDTDSATDRVFGTIYAALAGDNGGANQNGSVTIVTSGRFPENLTITAANGNVTLEAAEGVHADIDAVVAGAAGNAERQATVGVNVAVDADANRIVVLRNLTIRNFAEGVRASGNARVIMNNVRLDSNVSYGIRALGNARVTVANGMIAGSGFRFAPGIDNASRPGTAIIFEGNASGSILDSVISSNAAVGIANVGQGLVRVAGGVLSDNAVNTMGSMSMDSAARQ
jgi:hypothetical protein